jgi:hypothetical protein
MLQYALVAQQFIMLFMHFTAELLYPVRNDSNKQGELNDSVIAATVALCTVGNKFALLYWCVHHLY